ncbi:MAG: DNA glycosylase [Candidatus Dojkabacteria bacterium]
MNKLDIENYNLELTLLGGQSFTWNKVNEIYLGTHRDCAIAIKEENNSILWQTYPVNNNNELIEEYLNIYFDYNASLKEILKDKHIIAASKQNNGVRLLNQDFETVLMNFILSSHKSVKGVRKLVKDISKKYGNSIKSEYGESYTFPSAKAIALLSENDLRDIGAGFRAPYLKAAAEKLVTDKKLIKDLGNKTTSELKEYLTSFKGIGNKIADCILVFGLGRLDITPLDIWAKRVLIEFYALSPKLNYLEMSTWYTNYFGKNTAIAGQILFEYIRNLPKPKQKK